jgi:hypothetical protein
MWRTLPVCALLLLPSLAVRAADQLDERVIRLTVQPMPAPKPALKYQLLPELGEMNPGNPILGYSKCFAEQHNFWRTKEVVEKRERWQKMPLADLPLQELRNSPHIRGKPLAYADYAARLDTPDWQILLQSKHEGPLLLLPDLQQLRELAGALKVRFRVEVAERRFEDALGTAKTMLALSRHLGEHPTLIGELVGIAVATLTFHYGTLGPLDEMVQQVGCPNLFWALTDLPQPFIDLRKGVQGDRMMMTDIFALIDEKAPMNEAQVQQAADRLRRLVEDAHVIANVSDWLKTLSHDEGYIRAARKRLIDAGLAEEKVKLFPASQVVLLEEKFEFSRHRDESRKAMSLPYWQAADVLSAAPPPRKEHKDAPLRWLKEMGSYLKVKQAQTRLDQRIALLRCVEALRIYAAEYDGKVPAKLDDIRLPLPVDPATGKPFSYKVDGKTAHLHGEPVPIRVRYEVTINK